MIKSLLFLFSLGIIVAIIGKYLIDAGVFRRITTQGLDKCHLLLAPNGDDQAFEDLVIDYETGTAYLVGDNRAWLPTNDVSRAKDNKRGKLFTFDIASEKFTQLELKNYPFQHFHPLGVNLLKKNNLLFMTNYRTDDNGGTLGTVEIFRIDSSKPNQITWIDTVANPLFTEPDDILIIDENTFYVTNVYHFTKDKAPLLHTFEIVTRRPWNNLLLCSKIKRWKCSILIDSIAGANGVASSLDGTTFYLAATLEKAIRVYERDPEDNTLAYKESYSVPFLIDNINVDENDQLSAAGHPKAFEFLMHLDNAQKHHAPSEVILFPNPKSNSTYQTLLVTNGELLSASTIGAIYRKKLLVGGLIDPGILLCDNLF